jgi:hypothetical protein
MKKINYSYLILNKKSLQNKKNINWINLIKKIFFLLILINFVVNYNPIACDIKGKSNIITELNVLPSIFDWRNIDGVNYLSSIKNQAPAPTCEAYALCTSLETMIQYKLGYKFNCDLSEAHLFFYSGGTCNWGVDIKKAADYLIEQGIPDEGCFPDPHRPFDTPFESLAGWENRTVKIKEWGWVNNDVDSIKNALVNYGPLCVCILVRPDFYTYRSGIYNPNDNFVLGGHVINIIGYNDNEQCWILRNSWGINWGDNGYMKVSYDVHSSNFPFFWPFYGGTGIIYVKEVYGNLKQNNPKIQIITPKLYHIYINNNEMKMIIRKKIVIQEAVPILIGENTIKVNTENTSKVEFFLDSILKYTDYEEPFEWTFYCPRGLHTIETYAYQDKNLSKDIIDIYILF